MSRSRQPWLQRGECAAAVCLRQTGQRARVLASGVFAADIARPYGTARLRAQQQPCADAPFQLAHPCAVRLDQRSEEHTSELQSLMRISYAVLCLKKKNSTYQSHSQKRNHRIHHPNDHSDTLHAISTMSNIQQ